MWKKGVGTWGGTNPHDRFEFYHKNPKPILLNGYLLHYSYESVADFKRKNRAFAEIAAEAMFRKGIRAKWWKRFVQSFKMTRELDLTTMVTDNEKLTEHRKQLEEIEDLVIWAMGQTAMSKMTKTIREKEPANQPLHQLYQLFRLQFTPKKNKHKSRADFFVIKREKGEIAADVWRKLLENGKNCEFVDTTPSELLASKIMSRIGKSTDS